MKLTFDSINWTEVRQKYETFYHWYITNESYHSLVKTQFPLVNPDATNTQDQFGYNDNQIYNTLEYITLNMEDETQVISDKEYPIVFSQMFNKLRTAQYYKCFRIPLDHLIQQSKNSNIDQAAKRQGLIKMGQISMQDNLQAKDEFETRGSLFNQPLFRISITSFVNFVHKEDYIDEYLFISLCKLQILKTEFKRRMITFSGTHSNFRHILHPLDVKMGAIFHTIYPYNASEMARINYEKSIKSPDMYIKAVKIITNREATKVPNSEVNNKEKISEVNDQAVPPVNDVLQAKAKEESLASTAGTS